MGRAEWSHFFLCFFLFIFLACLTWSLLCDMPGLGMLQDCSFPSWGEYMFLCSNCAGFRKCAVLECCGYGYGLGSVIDSSR